MTKRLKSPKVIIGWREWCGLPALMLPSILAKIDTGAKTSALHAFDIKASTRGEGWLQFSVHPLQRRKNPIIVCEALCVDERTITSSNGNSELRPVIQTEITVGERRFTTEITLTNRDEMGFRMLIGRQTLSKRFIVDPAQSYCCGDLDEHSIYAVPPAPLKKK